MDPLSKKYLSASTDSITGIDCSLVPRMTLIVLYKCRRPGPARLKEYLSLILSSSL